jgi:hypothetical protein
LGRHCGHYFNQRCRGVTRVRLETLAAPKEVTYSPFMRTLWASTKIKKRKINIWVESRGMRVIDGYTDRRSSGTIPYIVLAKRIMNNPAILDETLLHELIHCVEMLCEKELDGEPPQDCTVAATVFGQYLSQALRNLRQRSAK